MESSDNTNDRLALNRYSSPEHFQTGFTKLMFSLNQSNYWNNQLCGTTDLCPCCNKKTETFDHITKRSSPIAASARSLLLINLRSDLEAIFTPKIIIKTVLETLPNRTITNASPLIQALLTAQQDIGLDSFLTAHISVRWQPS